MMFFMNDLVHLTFTNYVSGRGSWYPYTGVLNLQIGDMYVTATTGTTIRLSFLTSRY